MTTLHLTTFQRIHLTNAIAKTEGNAQVIRMAIKLIDIVEMTKEEKERIGFTPIVTPNGEGVGWRDTSCEWDIEIGDDNMYALIKKRMADYIWPKGTLETESQRIETLGLLKMLGIE